eukprot:gene1950-3786_t
MKIIAFLYIGFACGFSPRKNHRFTSKSGLWSPKKDISIFPSIRGLSDGFHGGAGFDGTGNGGNGGGNVDDWNGAVEPSGDPEMYSSHAFVLLLSKFFDAYTNLLLTNPYPTKIISSGIVGGLGDILIQNVQNKMSKTPKPFDFRRLLVFVTVAAFYIAPVIHLWFGYLDSLPFLVGMGGIKKSLVMMILDQTFGAVVVNLFFFVAFEIAQRLYPPYNTHSKSLFQACVDNCKSSMWITLIANWKCWPIINFVNFLYIPVEYRVLFSNVISIFWNMFLSSVANRNTSSGKDTDFKE